MITYSAQHRIVNDLALSFQQSKKIHTKISKRVLDTDLQFLNPKKYSNQTNLNFKFIVLWTIFKNNSNKIDTFKLINSYDKDQLKSIIIAKERILFYKTTLVNDTLVMNRLTKSPKVVFEMYRSNKLSILYVYKFFKETDYRLTRIQKRQVDRINFFMSFFPKIEEQV